ncbi:hypothetical protein B566_EDAN003932 [Ephemera danica]|nr:hypothetical protein B566_EDAN003932 [Ephemera danica]
MLNFQVSISFALLVAAFGNPAVPGEHEFQLHCDAFTPIVVPPEQAEGEWFGVEMVKNIGVGKRFVDSKKTCLYGEVKAVNSTRSSIDQRMLEGEEGFDHNKSFFADLDPATGVISLEGYPGKELRIIALKDNKYITVVYCGKMDTLSFVPITKIVTFRRPGTPDLPQKEEKEMHDEIKSKLGVDLLIFGKMHCRYHGKH